MPGTTNIGENIRELYKVKRNPSESSEPSVAKKRSRSQIIAIAESQARKASGKSPKQPETPHYEKPRKWT